MGAGAVAPGAGVAEGGLAGAVAGSGVGAGVPFTGAVVDSPAGPLGSSEARLVASFMAASLALALAAASFAALALALAFDCFM